MVTKKPKIEIVSSADITPKKGLRASDYVSQGTTLPEHDEATDFNELDKNVFTTFITIRLAFSSKRPEMMWGHMEHEGEDVEANDVLDACASVIENKLEEGDASGEGDESN